MTFAQPLWFIALALMPLAILLYIFAEKNATTRLARLIAAKLIPHLTGGVDRGKRAVRFSLTLLGLAALITALARPQLGSETTEIKRKGRDIVVVVDTSKSMLADDVSPNRLSRAKLAVQDLLRILDGDRIALVAFAGSAFLQAPLTIDYSAIEDSLSELDTSIIPKGGTNLAEAIQVSLDAFGKAEGSNKAIVLFTDGEELDADALKAAAKAKEAGVKIFTVGIGSSAGALIPIQENGESTFVRDEAGQFVKTKLDESRLKEIAAATDGFYVHLENGSDAVQTLLDQGIRKLEEKEGDAKMQSRPIERYQWPLGLAIVLIMLAGTLSDRRRRQSGAGAVAFILALLCLAPHARAAEMPQFFDQDKRAFNAGVGSYNGKNYDQALESFAKASTSHDLDVRKKAEYNAANTLFMLGGDKMEKDWSKAIDYWKESLTHYDEALKIDPKYGDAKDNRDQVEKLIKDAEEKKKDQDKRDQKDNKDQNKDQKDQKDQKNGQGQDQKNQQQQKSDKSDKSGNSQQQKGQNDQQQQGNSDKKDEQLPNSNQNQASNQQRGDKGQPTPEPMPTPGDKKEGELKTAESGEKKDDAKKDAEKEQQMAEAEPEKDGEMSKAQAAALLQSMQGEEERVNLRDMPNPTEVSKDW